MGLNFFEMPLNLKIQVKIHILLVGLKTFTSLSKNYFEKALFTSSFCLILVYYIF